MEKWLQDNILKIAIIISLPLWIAFALAEDNVIGHTEHGIPVTQEDLEIKSIRIGDIRSYKWIESSKSLRVTLRSNKEVDITFWGVCWELKFNPAGLYFQSRLSSSFVGKGDKVFPVESFQTRPNLGCIIDKMYEVEKVDIND